MEARGDLYLDRYEGWYSVRDEAYYEADELRVEEGGEKLSPHGTPVEWTVEESWFFRLSKYQQPLLDLYAANPDFIRPESRRNEVVRFVGGGLKDLSISRTSFDWGVPVPGSDNHVMYVWLDALTNYITGLGYPDDTALWQRFWPADVHLIGKDVVRFHAVYWPAFLMSAGLALPRQVYGHGFLLSRGEKMSKSVGNVVDPMVLSERFGVDSLRYFLLREVPFGQDGSYSAEAIVNRANAELANSFGNLAQRTLSMVFRNLGGIIPPPGEAPDDRQLLELIRAATRREIPEAFERFAFSVGIEAWLRGVFACNAYIDYRHLGRFARPILIAWLAFSGLLVEAIRDLTSAIAPIIPENHGQADDLAGLGQGWSAHSTAEAALPEARAGGGRSARGTRARRSKAVRLIDSHCHLNYEGLVERQAEVLENARERGVTGFLNISTRQKEWGDIISVAERELDVWASVGVHPHEADSHSDLGAAALVEAADHPRVIAIGECGLDYYYDKSDRAAQRERFQAHIEAARQIGLPLVVHTREAEEDTTEILERAVKEGGVTGVLHCFTGSAALARKGLDLGFYVSLSGIVTFKNAADLQATAKWLPADQMLVETDLPFLAPVPHRGKKCEPAFVADTASFVAQLRGEDAEQLADTTTENFFRLFKKAA